MSLSSGNVKSISVSVYKKFPEFKGVLPSISKQSTTNIKDSSKRDHTYRYLLTYKGVASLPGGHTMHKIVRVVANNNGKVLKMTLSK
ncbi:MAG: hypothetical protein CL789_03475 [Chloroflexi bacterium]|nr:hypothetical protein [Chloroflexota bacterium]HCU80918.1 hypothetical protein [Chloroflexota bacterium]